MLGREPGDGRRRRRHRRTVEHLFEIGLTLGNPLDADHQAARRAVGFDRRLRREPPLAQLRRQHLTHLVGEPRQPARRNFFAPEFEQKFAIHRYAPTVAVVCSTYALATPSASLRMLRMNAVRSVTP